MITTVLIVLVALVGLAATIGLLAWAYLREDNGDDERWIEAGPEQSGGSGVLCGSGVFDGEMAPDDNGRPDPGMDSDPSAEPGDEYADELRAIGQAAAADVLELHPVYDPAAICPVVAAAGQSLEDWHRCYKTANRRYWADRRREWKAETSAWWADYRDWRAEMGLAA